MDNYSVFDIIGPRMTGPSSSHTAGAARLSYTAWKIAGRDIAKARFMLYGSFAETGLGHGTDKALIGGMLGMKSDDPRIKDAYTLAKEHNLEVEVICSDETPSHPNTARITATNRQGEVTEILGESVGGGSIRIIEINGLDVELTGEYPTLIVSHRDKPGVIAEVTHVLAQMHINIAFMRVFRHDRGADAYMIIECDQAIAPDVQQLILGLGEEISKVYTV